MSTQYFLNLLFQQNYRKKWQVVFWLNTILLLYLTLSTPSELGLDIAHVDKLFHFLGFGAFSFFLYLGYPGNGGVNNLKIILISVALGIAVELAQSVIPYRSFDLADLAADFIGSVLAVLVLRFAQTRFIPAQPRSLS